ncbi:MAG: TIGR04282 family arsenosugar biosynthesis glycosyltransferase [Cyanobacteriota bacterium]|nr:TIGR04282 family arsenosugar biosynthesis glycosyltransferase [Cyanobacteriota bacterium]
MTQQRLVLLGRWPAPSRCKRRLAVSVGLWRAAAVQQRLLWHGLWAASQASREAQQKGQPMEVVFALTGLGPRATRRWGCSLPADRVVNQGEGSLGVRLQRQVRHAARDGMDRLVIVGTDLPQLCSADLLAAFQALHHSALVVGPASDGGYWLIGLSPQRLAPRLFAGAQRPIPWGTNQVLASTLEAAAAEGLKPFFLPERSDLDRIEDLLRWR